MFPEVEKWDILCHKIWKKCYSINGFAFGAPSRPKFFSLDSRTNLTIFSHGNSHFARI
jgi:hypothetical protein